ncbi:MAG: ABC transporter permease [Acidobacteria bacterium]|nr:ABC transporter permease [Acidobacteriota bacterium]
MFNWVGKTTLHLADGVGAYSVLIGQTMRQSLRRPFELREMVKQLEQVGVNSLPVVAVTALFTGMVLALQTYDGFRRFQAEGYVPALLGLALVRELVPVLGGMMVAGRVGSAMAAEVGTMKVTSQIDALQVMAADPVQFLVVPRVWATAIMLPLLIAIGDLIGIWGGQFLITSVLGEPQPGFMDRVFEFVDAKDFWSGMIKAFTFGAIVASVGCYQGLATRGGAEGVGKATTAAVVQGSLGILVADFFLTKVLF